MRLAIALLLSMFLLIAFLLRIRNLGELALIVDEGVQALAVRGILTHGVPKVDSGLIYSRDLLYLYFQAALARLFELNPFWLRIPSVLFGVAVILPSYMLGKAIFDRRVGLLTAAIMTFSVWEIELSRYARSYTAFQFMYLLSLLCFYRGFMLDERIYRIWFLVAAFGAFSTHRLSLVLATCLLIPFVSMAYSLHRKIVLGLYAIAFGALLMLYRQIVDLLNAMADPLLPAETALTASGLFTHIQSIIGLPHLFLPDLRVFGQMVQNHPVYSIVLTLPAGAATIYLILHSFDKHNITKVLLGISIIWTAFVHQIFLSFLMLSIYVVICRRHFQSLLASGFFIISGTVALYFILWLVIISTDQSLNLKELIIVLLGYPNVIQYFLYWFVLGWPAMTLASSIGCAIMISRAFSDQSTQGPSFIVAATLIPITLTGFFQSYSESRYIFHLYPMIVIIFSMVSLYSCFFILEKCILPHKVLYHWLSIAVFPVIFLLSQDTNVIHAWSVGDRTYQSVKDPIRSVISWKPYAGFHQDQQSPSLYVKTHFLPGDRVVALGPSYMLAVYHFYVGNIDYIIEPSKGTLSYGKLKDGKVIDYVVGSEVLRGLDGLKELMAGDPRGLWLLGDRILLDELNDYYSNVEKDYFRSLVKDPDFVGYDGKTFAKWIRSDEQAYGRVIGE